MMSMLMVSLLTMSYCQQPPSPEPGVKESLPSALRRLTDDFRLVNKLPVLAPDEDLDRVAQAHAAALAEVGDTKGDLHVSGGKGLQARLDEVGYPYAAAGENVQANDHKYPVREAMRALKASPPHRATMLSKVYTHVGVGVARSRTGVYFFVQVFGKKR